MAVAKSPIPSVKDTEAMMTMMLSPQLKDDPYAWVMYSFPWGVKGTPLEFKKGPRAWQKAEMLRIRDHIKKNHELMAEGKLPEVYQSATVSGRGPGKSALVSWLNLWHMSTKLGAPAILSANTESQLSSKTFAEIGFWHTLMINSYWFERQQTKIIPAGWLAKALKEDLKVDTQYYYVDGVLWNEDDPNAFVGAHSQIGMMLSFDEASGIPEKIWTAAKGFFTDISPYRFWFVFSNPRSNTGAFFECFHRFRESWNTRKINSLDVEGLDHGFLKKIVADFGEDSDEARIEVFGEFPRQGDRQFISRGVVAEARSRELERYDDHAALLMGVDPARFGDDCTVIRFRRGRDARSIPAIKLKGKDNMQVANACAGLIDEFNPDAVFIDSGAGAGVIDRLKEMGYKVFEVGFGTASDSPEWADHRTELWGRMRSWLAGAMIDSDSKLLDDLTGPEYEFVGREDKIKLESKEKMKKRGLSSPDNADALAMTFHANVARSDRFATKKARSGKSNKAKGMDYTVLK